MNIISIVLLSALAGFIVATLFFAVLPLIVGWFDKSLFGGE